MRKPQEQKLKARLEKFTMTPEKAKLSSAIHQQKPEMVARSSDCRSRGVFDTLKIMVRMILGIHDIQIALCGLDDRCVGGRGRQAETSHGVQACKLGTAESLTSIPYNYETDTD